MELLEGNVKQVYLKYLGTCFGSAMITSIYQLVDTIVVGQYQGPQGAAAMAVIIPMWTILYSLGLLFGVGGATLMSNARGAGDNQGANRWYTLSLLGVLVAAGLIGVSLLLGRDSLLRLFGADDALLPLCRNYLRWLLPVLPAFTLGEFLTAFLRNDGAPARATVAVITGGAFNIFGDLFFVFGLDMGIEGAGLATALGQLITMIILLTHYRSPKRGFRLVRPTRVWSGLAVVAGAGASVFVVDLSMGIVAAFFNNQVMRYAGTAALAIYGVACNLSTLVQCFSYGVGQAAQPLLSMNFGAQKLDRVHRTIGLAAATAAAVGLACALVAELFPLTLIHIFMDATPQVAAVAPAILRVYCIAFVLLPLNVLATYYFQAILQPGAALTLSLLRGVVFSGFFVYMLPACFGVSALWWAVPGAELVSFLLVLALLNRYRRDTA